MTIYNLIEAYCIVLYCTVPRRATMGIPSYFSNIVKQYKHVIKKLGGLQRIHNLYMDTNGLIYDAVRVVGSNRGLSDAEYESKLLETVCAKIDEYLAMFRPTNNVFIAFDGVAPVAKLNQQRERRYKSWFTTVVEQTITRKNALLDPLSAGSASVRAVSTDSKSWNTSAITPGTAFMKKLNIRMNDYCAMKGREIGNTVAYIYSGSDAAGEGEHKLFEYIRENAAYHRDTTTLIYGLDADLIMLCLNHLHISHNIYLYRDTPDFIQSLDSTLSCTDQYYLDIPAFACSLEAVMRETASPDVGSGSNGAYVSDATTVAGSRSESESSPTSNITPEVIAAIDDYIVMAFMLGNDFMPHFPSLNLRTNGMTVLLQTYANMFRESKEYLVTRKAGAGAGGQQRPTIVWKTMRAFIALLAETEHNRLMNEHKARDRQSKQRYGGGGGGGGGGGNGRSNPKMGGLGHKTDTSALAVPTVTVDIRDLTKIACSRVVQLVGNVEQCHSMTDFMAIPMQERSVEKYIDPFRENWEYRYYDALFDIDIYASSRKGGGGGGGGNKKSGGSGSVDRLQMICVNYIEGLEWTMRYYSTGCVDWRWTYKYPYAPLLVDLMRFMPHMDTALFPGGTPVKNPVRDIVQLCYVLPMASHGLLPPVVAEKLKRSYSHYYCDKLDFKWSYCKYFWEAHTELPHIRISELERAVEGV